MLRVRFEAQVIHWRGPAPFFFAPVPADAAAQLREVAGRVSYGWGMIPVEASVGGVSFTTSLFPKDGGYLLPLKDRIRQKLALTAGDPIAVEMVVRPARV